MNDERKRPRRLWHRAGKILLAAAAAYAVAALLVTGFYAVMVAAVPKERVSR